MYHNPMFPLARLFFYSCGLLVGRCINIVRLSGSQKSRYPCAECSGLCPAAVCERRVVRSWRVEVPLSVSSIKSSAVPVSILVHHVRETERCGDTVAELSAVNRVGKQGITEVLPYLTTSNTAGGPVITE
jgi:hypothetical protein